MQTSSNLKVTIYWGDVIYDTRVFPANSAITVGNRPGSTFILDLNSKTGKSQIDLVRINSDNQAEIQFDDDTDGILRLGKEVLSLAAAKESPHVIQDKNNIFHAKLNQKDKAEISIGHVTFYIDWIKKKELLPKISSVGRKEFFFSLIVFLFIAGTLFSLAFLVPPQKPETPPERLVTLVKKVQHAKAAVGALKSTDGGTQKQDLGKAELTPKVQPAPEKVEQPSAASLLKKANLGTTVSNLSNLGVNAPNVDSKPTEDSHLQQTGVAGLSTEGLKVGAAGKSIGIGRKVGDGEGGFEGTGKLGLSGNSIQEGGTGHGMTTTESGGLDRDLIESIIRRRQDRIRLCYVRQLNFNPKLSGKIAIHFVIGKTGAVSTNEITEDTMKNQPIRQCILEEVKTWTFPAPTGGTAVNVNYPFVFESSAQNG